MRNPQSHLSCPLPSRHTGFLSNSGTFQAHPSLRVLRPTQPSTRTSFLGVDPCSHMGPCACWGPRLGLMPFHHHLDIVNRFEGGLEPSDSCGRLCLYLEHSALSAPGSFSHPGLLCSNVTSPEGPSLAICPEELHPVFLGHGAVYFPHNTVSV